MGTMGSSSNNNVIGFTLAIVSSGFIGCSFIIKKKGLRRAANSYGLRAGYDSYPYLWEPLWWFGMIASCVYIFQLLRSDIDNFPIGTRD